MAFPTTAILDDFSAGSGNLTSRAGWGASLIDGSGTTFTAGSGVASHASAGGSNYWDTPAVDAECYVVIGSFNPAVGAMRVCTRIQSPGASANYYALYVARTSATSFELFKVVGGSQTLVSASIATTVAAGDSIGIRVRGSLVETFYKSGAGAWVAKHAATDSSITGSGFIGGFAKDNFGDTQTISDFGGDALASPLAGSYAAEVLADSPLAYWHLNETGSNPFEDVAGGHSATPNGTIVTAASLVPTNPDAAARFNPAGTLFQGQTAWKFPGTQPVTVEFWIKPISILGADMYAVVDTVTGVDGFSCSMVATTGAWRWVSHNVGVIPFSTPGVAGKLQHVVFVMITTGECSLYIDGTLRETSGVVGMLTPTENLYLGHPTVAVNADLDEVAIYNTALSAARILAHYAAGIGKRPQGASVRRVWAGA